MLYKQPWFRNLDGKTMIENDVETTQEWTRSTIQTVSERPTYDDLRTDGELIELMQTAHKLCIWHKSHPLFYNPMDGFELWIKAAKGVYTKEHKRTVTADLWRAVQAWALKIKDLQLQN